MRAFSVSYNNLTDITKIKFTKEFDEAHYILKLDVLKDAIHDLEQTYNQMLRQKADLYLAMGANLKEE